MEGKTTMSLSKDVHKRFSKLRLIQSAKVGEGISVDKFLEMMMDKYEGKQ